MRNMPMLSAKKQTGAALAISLILLIAMTVLGVATLNGTRMAEKVSSNAQQKAIVFETSESVINSIYSADDITTRFTEARTLFSDPPPNVQDAENNLINAELDQTNTFGTSVDVTAEGSIQYCGEAVRLGSGMEHNLGEPQDKAILFDIRGNSSIANSNAKAEHVLRVEDGGFSFNLTGNCVTPGS